MECFSRDFLKKTQLFVPNILRLALLSSNRKVDRDALVALLQEILQKYAAAIEIRSKKKRHEEILNLYKGYLVQRIYIIENEVRSIPVTDTIYWLRK